MDSLQDLVNFQVAGACKNIGTISEHLLIIKVNKSFGKNSKHASAIYIYIFFFKFSTLLLNL